MGDAEAVEPVLHRLEVRAGGVAEALRDLGRVLDDVLPVGVLGVEDPERVGGDPIPERLAQRVAVLQQVRREELGVAGAVGLVAHRVDAQREVAEAESPVEAVRECDDLDVELRVVDAQHLRPHLEVLAVPALLGPLVAEVRRDVPDLPRHDRVVLRERARDAAVPSGRSATRRPPLSSKSYISLRTTSVDSPTRWNTSRCSKIGVMTRSKP